MYYTTAPWPKYPSVYEINARTWIAGLSARAGHPLTLDKVPDEELERLARLGMHGLWLMGVWTTGSDPLTIAREYPGLQQEYRRALSDFAPQDVVGSPYAVTDYTVSERLGGPAALASFRERMQRHGLRLILDFVCNHTARDHRYVREHPELYIQGTPEDLAREPQNFFRNADGVVIAHGRDPYFPAWSDTAQLNYGQPATREAFRQTMLGICEQCDGLRCDMAMLILPEPMERLWGGRLGPRPVKESFWRESIAALRESYPNALLMAESYWDRGGELQSQGFHFTYDKTLYDKLRQNDFGGVKTHLQKDGAFHERCVRFIENHDEERAATAFGAAGARGAAVATFFCSGLRLFHHGQLEGHRIKVPVQLGRSPSESEDVETALFYEKILGALQDPLFQEGRMSLRPVNTGGWSDSSFTSLLAYSWTLPPEQAKSSGNFLGYLVVVNLGGWRAYGRIPLPAETFSAGKSFVFYDRFDAKRYERDGGELAWPGLYVALEAHQPHIFEISRK
ncbi:MAG TPA: alpha-amylase family glycosyl hydrolase [Planctomycetota bacterium]|jgi:hypothetical protein